MCYFTTRPLSLLGTSQRKFWANLNLKSRVEASQQYSIKWSLPGRACFSGEQDLIFLLISHRQLIAVSGMVAFLSRNYPTGNRLTILLLWETLILFLFQLHSIMVYSTLRCLKCLLVFLETANKFPPSLFHSGMGHYEVWKKYSVLWHNRSKEITWVKFKVAFNMQIRFTQHY